MSEFSFTKRITGISVSVLLPLAVIFFFNFHILFPFALLIDLTDINFIFRVQSIFYICICVLIIKRSANLSLSDLGINKVKKNTFWSSLLLASIVPIIYLALRLIAPDGSWLVVNNFIDFLGVMVSAVLEELLFRGAIQKSIEKYTSPNMGIVLQAIVFGVAHFQSKNGYIPIIIGLILVGFSLGLARKRSDSLLPGIIGHALQNLVTK